MLEPNLNSIEPDQHATARPFGARGIYRRRVMRPLVFAVPVALLSF